MYKSKFMAMVVMIFSVNSNVFAELIFSAPPRGTEAEERATYEPLVKAMSEVIGEQVRYVYPRGFLEYSVNMQKGLYDIVFDGPHFSQWRVANLHHTILVNLPENLQFLVVTPQARTHVNTLRDLIYESVCAQMTPQLGTLMLLQNYYHRAAEPQLHLVHGEEKVFSDFSKGKCTAAVLRDKRFFKIAKADRATYKVIYKSAVAPNDAITVNDKFTQEQRKALIALLTNPETMKVAGPIFDRFSRKAVAFDLAEPDKFEGLDQLLLLAFGWDLK
ncbi:MAG: PhnD/SsuA/transferrin family substrate-binding protein [Gammaproteobacteria bacterium]|jgi:hypothetical protein